MAADEQLTPQEIAAARMRQLGDQFAASITTSVLVGLATSLVRMQQQRTLEAGPWILNTDATLTPVPADVIEMLRRHVVDWGGCDHPTTCDCSDAQARRALAPFVDVPMLTDDDPLDVVADLWTDYDEWRQHRSALSTAETAGERVDPGDWHDSDDRAAELLDRFATVHHDRRPR